MSRGNIYSEKRILFGQQASQFVILDSSISPSVIQSVIKSLRNVLSLAITLSGPSRIPYFGLCLVSNKISMLYPLQNIRNNSQRLMDTLDNWFNFTSQNDGNIGDIISSNFCSNLQANLMQVLRSIMEQHKEILPSAACGLGNICSGSTVSVRNQRNKIEVTIISFQVRECVQAARGFCRASSIAGVKRIHVVQPKLVLNSLDNYTNEKADDNKNILNDEQLACDQNSESRKRIEFEDVSSDEGIIELTHLQSNHEVVFEDVFKGWLMNTCTDQEHLHIRLPVQSGSGGVTIKCDIQECLVNPSSLSCASDLLIELDHAPSRALAYSSASKQGGRLVPIYRLTALARLPANSVCESLIFGPPCLVKPTMCWRLDLEELTRSQLLFQELCRSLMEDDSALVLRRDGGETVSGHFLLLPVGDSCLLKSLASRDLLLPRQEAALLGEPSGEVSQQISDCLSALEQQDHFNPVMFQSGLYAATVANLNLSSKSTAVRRGGGGRPRPPHAAEDAKEGGSGYLSFGYAEKKLHLDFTEEQ